MSPFSGASRGTACGAGLTTERTERTERDGETGVVGGRRVWYDGGGGAAMVFGAVKWRLEGSPGKAPESTTDDGG